MQLLAIVILAFSNTSRILEQAYGYGCVIVRLIAMWPVATPRVRNEGVSHSAHVLCTIPGKGSRPIGVVNTRV